MIDGPSPIDQLLVEGPRAPVETLRPLVNLQRVLLLDGDTPFMVDLATGDVRQWENGPPLLVPCVSTPFELSAYTRLQTQVLRDPRPTPVDLTLLSIQLGTCVIDVMETTNRRLEIRASNTSDVLASDAIGDSLAIVIAIEPVHDQGVSAVSVSARNAETVKTIEATVAVPVSVASLTIGGPSTSSTGAYGRRRLIPASLDVTRRVEPIDQVQRVVRKVRRVLGNIRARA